MVFLFLKRAMITFHTTIQKFGSQGEKTGWTYILIPARIASRIRPGVRTSFRVSGELDEVAITAVALLPMGEGDFILPLKAELRKKLHKAKGDRVKVSLREEKKVPPLSSDLLSCLKDEPGAKQFFDKLPGSHKRYYANWVESAKTEATRTRRIAAVIHGLLHGMTFPEMMRWSKEQKNIRD